MSDTKPRRDTKLESEAAEFLVLGRLLLERITAFKNYVNHPAYDLIAANADRGRSARIQVKSRYSTDWDGFIINNLDCDFVVFVALNRGFTYRRNKDGGVKEPEFYVLPIYWVAGVRDPNNTWGKIVKHRLAGIERYKDQWQLIRDFLTDDPRSSESPGHVPRQ